MPVHMNMKRCVERTVKVLKLSGTACSQSLQAWLIGLILKFHKFLGFQSCSSSTNSNTQSADIFCECSLYLFREGCAIVEETQFIDARQE